MTVTLRASDPLAFSEAVDALKSFNAGASKLLTGNFAVAVAVLLHRDGAPARRTPLIGLPGSALIDTGLLQTDVCDRTWIKERGFLPASASGDVFKPFTSSFKGRSPVVNNWRNSFDLQGGLGCDAPYTSRYLMSEEYLGQHRVDCDFRNDVTGRCASPVGGKGEVRTCFNPNKKDLPPGPSSLALSRPKLLNRGVDSDGHQGYWFVEPTLDVLADLLGAPEHRVPVLPFAVALYGGSPYWQSEGSEVSEERLVEDLGLDEERFYTLFDPNPRSPFNARMLQYARRDGNSMAEEEGTRTVSPPSTENSPTASDTGQPEAVTRNSIGLSSPIPYQNRSADELFVRASRESDPQRRAKMLERANRGHRRALNELALLMTSGGYEVSEQLDGFDLCARLNPNDLHLFEVKTWTPTNLAKQVRAGWAQLYEYRHRNRDSFSPLSPKMFLVFNRQPPAEYWAWSWLVLELEVVPCWMSEGILLTFDEYLPLLPAVRPPHPG